jgi:hypothetical protein
MLAFRVRLDARVAPVPVAVAVVVVVVVVVCRFPAVVVVVVLAVVVPFREIVQLIATPFPSLTIATDCPPAGGGHPS